MTVTPVTPDMVIAKLNEHLGYRYAFDNRCTGISGAHDCSGYQCWMMNSLGLTSGYCTSSFVMAQSCYDHGLIIGADEARATKAVWAFHGPNGGRGPSHAVNGSDGHIVCGAGDGTTREAMGRRYGVVVGPWDGRAWVAYSKIPGVDYAPPVPPLPPQRERDMVIQSGRKPNLAGETAYAILSPDGLNVQLWFGASIANDQPTSNKYMRAWHPIALAQGHKLVGLARRVPNTTDEHPGVLAVDDTGKTHNGHWS